MPKRKTSPTLLRLAFVRSGRSAPQPDAPGSSGDERTYAVRCSQRGCLPRLRDSLAANPQRGRGAGMGTNPNRVNRAPIVRKLHSRIHRRTSGGTWAGNCMRVGSIQNLSNTPRVDNGAYPHPWASSGLPFFLRSFRCVRRY